MDTSPSETWQTKVARKQLAVKAKIPSEWLLPSTVVISSNVLKIPRQCGLLSEKELELTEAYDAKQLLDELSTGALSSAEVTAAFCKRAAIAQQLTSCLTETMFDHAKERAAFLDSYLAKEKKVFGPLHGFPISLKDSFNIKGVQSTIGIVSFLDREPPKTNSVLVNTLLELGAVLYVKTNVPQAVLTPDSHNNIFGRTLNPLNTKLTAGGSSGGEGALIALRGSILGVGTDLAGSIRTPSLCCGVYGFKPSAGRVPWGGQTGPGLKGITGITGMLPSAGPMATSLADLELFMSSVLDTNPWLVDSDVHPVPWKREYSNSTVLTIGILAEDPIFPLHPPIRRAIKKATKVLAAAGHKIIELKHSAPIRVSLGTRLAIETMIIDPDSTPIKNIDASNEPLIPSLKRRTDKKIYGVPELAALNVEIHDYKEAWREVFKDKKLDVILGPGAQHTAVEHDKHQLPAYSCVWNLLDYPACLIPYSSASKDLDPDFFAIKPPSKGASYDPAVSDGMPCAIQVIAPRFQDEKCLHAARVIEDLLKKDQI